MDGEIDYSKYSEPELLEVFGRLDPRYAPINCARLKELLIQRGYIVHEGIIGPGTATLSAEKMQELIGSPRPISYRVRFDQTTGIFRWLEPSHNDFGLVGTGTLEANGVDMWLRGRRAAGIVLGVFGSLFPRREHLYWRRIVNVESEESLVHFTYREEGSRERDISIWLPNHAAADRLAKVLPAERTATFRPRLSGHTQFDQHLLAQSPQTPVTVGLVILNALIFLAMVAAGAGLLQPAAAVPIAWGSNFGPYTTDGDWWRLLTCLFIHFGVLHLIFNMWALASFGPLVERLYGSANYLIMYLIAGVAGSLASISWRPDINSAGASGAIFGILGALLAAQLRVGKTFPASVLRPLRNTTTAFTACALLVGFLSEGIDNAAHLGGVTSGFLLGSVVARPINGLPFSLRRDFTNLAKVFSLGALLLVGGIFSAHRASGFLAGDALFYRTLHWFEPREAREIHKVYEVQVLAGKDPHYQSTMTHQLEAHTLPFWREAAARFTSIHLPSYSKNAAALAFIRSVAEGRITGYELLDAALKTQDPQIAASAQRELKRVDALIADRQAQKDGGT